MFRWIAPALVVGLLAVAPAHAQTPAAAPAQQAQAQKSPFVFQSDGGVILHFVKADKGATFEMLVAKLKEALAKSEKPERKQQAAGWKIFKTTQPGPQNSVVYVMRIDPIVKGQEYDISRLIAEVFPVEVQELFAKYKEAFAGRSILFLKPFMEMQ